MVNVSIYLYSYVPAPVSKPTTGKMFFFSAGTKAETNESLKGSADGLQAFISRKAKDETV